MWLGKGTRYLIFLGGISDAAGKELMLCVLLFGRRLPR